MIDDFLLRVTCSRELYLHVSSFLAFESLLDLFKLSLELLISSSFALFSSFIALPSFLLSKIILNSIT